jgi:hypothetical protein
MLLWQPLDVDDSDDPVSIVLIDEGDFFIQGDQKKVRDTIEPYNTKSNSQVIFVSTPNMPNGLMQNIEKESNDYQKLRLDYTIGLHKIYMLEEIRSRFPPAQIV